MRAAILLAVFLTLSSAEHHQPADAVVPESSLLEVAQSPGSSIINMIQRSWVEEHIFGPSFDCHKNFKVHLTKLGKSRQVVAANHEGKNKASISEMEASAKVDEKKAKVKTTSEAAYKAKEAAMKKAAREAKWKDKTESALKAVAKKNAKKKAHKKIVKPIAPGPQTHIHIKPTPVPTPVLKPVPKPVPTPRVHIKPVPTPVPTSRCATVEGFEQQKSKLNSQEVAQKNDARKWQKQHRVYLLRIAQMNVQICDMTGDAKCGKEESAKVHALSKSAPSLVDVKEPSHTGCEAQQLHALTTWVQEWESTTRTYHDKAMLSKTKAQDQFATVCTLTGEKKSFTEFFETGAR